MPYCPKSYSEMAAVIDCQLLLIRKQAIPTETPLCFPLKNKRVFSKAVLNQLL